jgi:hypothetical protein
VVDDAAETVGGGQQGGGRRYMTTVSAVWMWLAHGSDRAADGGPHTVSLLSLNYPNWLNYKNKK